MKIKPALWLFLLMIFLAAAGIAAEEPGKDLTGKVTGAAQDPKGFAGVTFNGPKRYVSMTDSTGKFTVKNVQKGQYMVTVSQGNKVQTFDINVDGGTNVDLRVKW